ncbi:glutathione S-transferase F3 [Perilla frutescens var. hirtella]|uniref:glutathione transferase n=1 Tax=Perilla frutescens var. hirtella TaxID=608512 RepID=A0AAD4IYV1_PERFH|nr:glutathione S-transferase F3 [Perilla frutescens var. hirtella]KAH6811155.1 glutathione S-transferase F3 [Perilla frutescens var. frutescens]KAH6823987.1 glutathione S-transferase F3 [Perilla frutescens var. hirtella]
MAFDFKLLSDDAIVDEQEAELNKVLDVYEDRLAQSKFLGGDCFTLADLHHLPTLDYLMASPVKSIFDSHPRVDY